MQLMNNYPPLEGVCKKAIEQGICTGCNKLELPWFRGVKDCKCESLQDCKYFEKEDGKI